MFSSYLLNNIVRIQFKYVMIVDSDADSVLCYMEYTYFHITHFAIYNYNKFCIHALYYKYATAIALQSVYL